MVKDLSDAFLSGTKWEKWSKEPIAADASARSYVRLRSPIAETVILMDAGKDKGTTEAFLQIAKYLTDAGLVAPKPQAKSTDNRFVLLNDLGRVDFAKHLTKLPNEELTLYQAAADVAFKLRKPTALSLATLDPKTAGKMVSITGEWYVENADAQSGIESAMTSAVAQNCGPATVLSLRDFHAENLIWRPEQAGTNRVGLLDFQDAFLAPEGYDLASLLRDVRRDVSAATQKSVIRYFAQKADIEVDQLTTQIATLAVQRNLRILGVFARLIRRDGKQKYAAFLPRVWRLICEDLQNPSLKELSEVVHATLPPPQNSLIAST